MEYWENPQKVVTPVKTGVQRIYKYLAKHLDSGFRRNDENLSFHVFYEFICFVHSSILPSFHVLFRLHLLLEFLSAIRAEQFLLGIGQNGLVKDLVDVIFLPAEGTGHVVHFSHDLSPW
jgi:hypothetical protein